MGHLTHLLAFLLLPPVAVLAAESAVTDLRVQQAIIKSQFTYDAQPQVRIAFTLRSKQEVTVLIARHLPDELQMQSEYIAEPFPVRTLKLGKLAAGPHEAVWDGLNDKGQPVTETRLLSAQELKALKEKEPDSTRTTREVPVDLFRVTAKAGGGRSLATEPAVNFLRHNGIVPAGIVMRGFMGAVLDSKGNALVADRGAWRGRRYSPTWRLEQTYPATSVGHSSDPVECCDAMVDSKDNLYLTNSGGIYKFGPDGNPTGWGADAPYINYPYPSDFRSVLGLRLDPNKKGKQRFTFGPGGGGAGSREIDTDEAIKTPGFAYQWGGAAIDSKDNVYLAMNNPSREIQVFDATGKFLRKMPMADNAELLAMRFGKDGTLWVCSGSLLGLDPDTGAVRKKANLSARQMHIDPDGTIYLFGAARLWRLNAAGEPLPFTSKAPCIREDGRELNLKPADNKVPAEAAGYTDTIMGVVGGRGGDFYVSASRSSDPNSRDTSLLHFAADGAFLPNLLSVELAQHRPGNVFVDDEPATFDLLINNISGDDQALAASWVLADFDGKQTAGSSELTAKGMARQTLGLTVQAPAMGYYRLKVSILQAGRPVCDLETQLARIRSRKLDAAPDSPFAMCWGTNFYLMGLAGVKWERVGPFADWRQDGLIAADPPGIDPPQVMQWPTATMGVLRYATRWGVLMPETFGYGEPWLGGGYPACRIYSYDSYCKYMLDTVDMFAGRVPYYQFWNEPNFFWHVPGPFSREHFALVTKHAWSIVKARDKEALCICDGDAGSPRMMDELAQHGANLYNDTAQIHYPGATPLKFDQIVVNDQPEGKVAMMRELVALRDRAYPGKPIWNTEEGWWGAKTKTPETGAVVVPRVYLPQIALGIDRIYWFAQTSADDLSYLLDARTTPNPAYVSYATMTRLLEGAAYIGSADLGKATFGYVFARPADVILAAWSVQGEMDAALDAGVKSATIIDLMDRTTVVRAVGGKLPLKLSEKVQYVTLPFNQWARNVAKAELERQRVQMNWAGPVKPGVGILESAQRAPAEPVSMTRLFYMVRMARQAAFAGVPMEKGVPRMKPPEARAAILKKEGPDGYLRQARIALGWAESLAREAARFKKPASSGLASAAAAAGNAAAIIAAAEAPAYPGVAINAYLEPKSVRDGADPAKPLDEKFAFEITRKPGESFELELTVWDYYRHGIEGVVSPRLPNGWKAAPESAPYAVEPGKFQRFVFTVAIPADAIGLCPVGAKTIYQGQLVNELHTQRVRVAK